MSVRDLLVDLILDHLADADEETLAHIYRALAPRNVGREARREAPTLPPPAPAPLPGSTRQVVLRALERLPAPAPLSEIARLVHQEQPAITPGSISGTLSKLVEADEVKRDGPPRKGVYYRPASGIRKAYGS